MKLKQTILRSLKLTGAFHSMAESRWRAESLLILCYHGISIQDEHEWRPSSFMPESQFESRLEMLRSGGYHVLPLEEAISKLYSKTLPSKSVVITFDDGLHNFYSRAYPILKKYNVPATLYLTTYYCDHQMPVFPLIASYLFWLNRAYVMPANPFLGFNHPIDLASASVRQQAEADFAAFAIENRLNSVQKNDLVRLLAIHLGMDFEALIHNRLFHLMTSDIIQDLARNGVDIQLHTHRHRTPKEQSLFQKEIVENRDRIVEFIQMTPTHFCYPSGVYRPENLPWLKELGVSSATTCDHALAYSNTNPLLLPRFLDSANVSPIEFESWLTGVGAYLRQTFYGRPAPNGH